MISEGSEVKDVNVLMLGPVSWFTKAIQAVGGSVSTLWGSGSWLPRNIDELAADQSTYRSARYVDDMSLRSMYPGSQAIWSAVRAGDIDVVHANSMAHLAKAWMAKRLLAIRYGKKLAIAISIHNSLPWLPSETRWRTRARALLIRGCADLAIPIAEFMRQRLLRYGMKPERAVTVHVCLDIEQFDRRARAAETPYLDGVASADHPLITYIAALQPWKGHEDYLRAAAQVLVTYPSARFLIVGDGPCRASLEQLAQDLWADKNVTFMGDVPPAAVPQILSASDVPVCASHSEMLPSAVLEAMTASKAIVATNVGGIPELVEEGVSGLLVPPGDADALAAGILALLGDPDKRRAMGIAARQFVESHNSLPVIGHQLMAAYRLALERAGHA